MALTIRVPCSVSGEVAHVNCALWSTRCEQVYSSKHQSPPCGIHECSRVRRPRTLVGPQWRSIKGGWGGAGPMQL